jgi:lipid-A-disaccharide synthase
MAGAGVEITVPQHAVAVVGIREVLSHYGELRRALATMTALARPGASSALLLVDFPGFNFRLGAAAKRAGLPVAYFIVPQVWAWRPGRVKTMAGFTDKAMVIFPFEEELLRLAGIDASYVGHPLVETTRNLPPRDETLRRHGLDPALTQVGLLPGSRKGEIGHHLGVLLETAHRLHRADPGISCFILRAPGPVDPRLDTDAIEGIRVVVKDGSGIIAAADALVGSSGTVTLEAALCGTPMAVIYRLSPASHLVGRALVSIPHIALPNILAKEEIFPEFIQGAAEPAALARAVQDLLSSGRERERAGLARIRDILGERLTSHEAAGILVEFLDRKGVGS